MKSRCSILAVGGWLWAATAGATPPGVQIEELLAGANGDSRIQFIEIKMATPADGAWGPQGGETAGRLRLVFFDAGGTQVGEFVFFSDAPVGVEDPTHGGYSVLVATKAFSLVGGMPEPDFLIAPRVMARDGKVCLTGNPANPNAPVLNLCLSYGNFVADTGSDTMGQPAGPPAAALPITDASALRRTANFGNYGVGQFNADFALGAPAPRNSSGDTGSIIIASGVDQGRTLFSFETFNGNGRTCLTCHQTDILFGLSPTKISFMRPTDPLFVAEHVAALAELENTCLLRGQRGVNLENIDGFSNPPVFRGSPNLVNLAFTAPYGRSAEFADLQAFATGAVLQHFPRTLARNAYPSAGPLDFRLPAPTELAYIEEFLLSITLPADGNFDLTRMIDAAIARGADVQAIQRGRDLFFGVTGSAKCFLCHSGPVLAGAVPALGGGNQAFNTGVAAMPLNQSFPDACLGGQPLPPEAGGTRTFSTPSLIGVARTAPYFHNNVLRTLREAVAFYAGPEFNNSPAAQNPLIGTISLTTQEIDDLTAFLAALDEPFIDCNANTIDDRVEMSSGSPDCNGNVVLDSCELADNDCNSNGVPDECDLAPLSFDAAASHSSVIGAFFITAADIDGDADADLLVPGWASHDVAVLLNNGNGTSFSPGGTYPVASYPRAVTVADFDADGDPDVAAPNLLVAEVSVFLNNGSDGGGQWLGLSPSTPIPMNAGPGQPGGSIFVLAVDVNGDTFPDLAVCKNFAHQVSIVGNRGLNEEGGWRGFGAPVDLPSGGTTPWSAAAGLFNADSAPDLVVANRASGTATLLLNNGDGTFAAPVSYAVQTSPESVAAADLDGDGDADAVAANADSDTLSIRLGDGAGGLGPAQVVVVGSYPFGAQPHSVCASDVDRDDDLDLLVANKVSKNVSIVLNDGDGNFPTLVNLPLPDGPDYAAVADLDADGGLDVAAVQFTSLTCWVLSNRTPPYGVDCNRNGLLDSCELQAGTVGDVNVNGVPDGCEFLGDLNRDGTVDAVDLAIFVDVLLGADTIPQHVTAADLDDSGAANGLDIPLFLALLLLSA